MGRGGKPWRSHATAVVTARYSRAAAALIWVNDAAAPAPILLSYMIATGKGASCVSEHLMQLPVLLFVGMMAAFGVVLLGCSVEDALRR